MQLDQYLWGARPKIISIVPFNPNSLTLDIYLSHKAMTPIHSLKQWDAESDSQISSHKAYFHTFRKSNVIEKQKSPIH